MTLRELEYLIALADHRHFGRAAEACGVTQPTLSAGVKQLEEQMGVLLVNRGSRFQGFTAEGERVLDWARRIVGDTRSMREEINALRHGLTGQLRIAAIPTALGMVAALTTPYRERHPNVRFTIYSRTSIEILELLDTEEVYVCGIATEYCVRNTCEDLLKAGFKVRLLKDCLAYVDHEGHLKALEEMGSEGIRIE
jgi:DNA-binding transcriptional LysR family regulator